MRTMTLAPLGLLESLSLLVPLVACATPPPASAPPPARPAAMTAGLDRTIAQLRAGLQADAKRAKKPLRHERRDGPAGTAVARAMIVGAYPGTGVRTALVDAAGVSYGRHGQRDLAQLVRARGWLAKPPAADLLMRVVNFGQYEGLLAWDTRPAPTLAVAGGALTLSFVRVQPLSQHKSRVTIVVPAKGKLQSAEAAIAEPPAAVAATPAAALERALVSKDAMEISGAISKLSGTKDPAGIAALAKASTIANDTLAVAALEAIGTSDAAVKALRAAWTTLSTKRRTQLLAFAAELVDDAFAARLK